MKFIPGYREANAPRRSVIDEPEAISSASMLKLNGQRTATIADLEHAEAVMGAKVLQQASALASTSASVSRPLVAEPAMDSLSEQDRQFAHFQSDAPACDNCGALTVRCGTCYRCFNCGNSMGCS